MKKWLWLFLLFIYTGFSAQIKDVVKWTYQLNKISDTEYEAVLTAKMDNGWHLYSKDLPPDSGIPTEMKVTSKDVQPVGGFREEGKKIEEFSEAFGAQIVYYSSVAKFIQKFKVKDPKKGAKVAAEITFQVCNDRVCLAPNTLEFEKAIDGTTETKAEEIKEQDSVPATTTITESPTNADVEVQMPVSTDGIKVNSLDFRKPLVDCGTEQVKEDSGNGLVFVLGFLGGLIALLTPCVFPMIPLTVSFFTKGAANKTKGKRNAIIYGLFILIIFVALSIPFYIIDGISGNIFNDISTNIWLNLFFFAIFLFFALSFFGYYEITLPNWIANKSAKAEEAGGLIGIFFMALTLVIVSFSCTGPILGSLLGGVASSSKNIPVLLTFALGGFGLAWAIVFGLLALFPQALQSLPKSGGWMNTIKVILGFIEVALALKFLSKADLVSKTFLLKREIFIGLWIIITIALVLYLFGKIRFPHDSKGEKISTTRKVLGILGIGFVLYLIPGLLPSEKPRLATLSGILPPMNVSLYKSEKDGILGLKPEHDYFKAIELAKKENKPVLIDFTGYGCENCRKMEEFVWSEPDILPIIQNDVILASVYVDDKEELPADQQTSIDMGNGQKKKIKTIGDKWSMFQQVNFNNNSQPHYVLVTPDQKVINVPVSGYMPKEEFKKFLECGINYYKKNK
ncbi:protein-disulfide reductase [Elizabethkingia meningoseptica]|uniref:thioredoxin family protein n=1 Tax=Elizabethkingia meningoseptica TaxID=238 RepID=UPI000332CDDE|nr:thioredoxin family protein [Elizabethkingia meningoseptica]AQX04087.1 protein-disulfide reductase [Elizabethkingia meningoseptica]AQX46128.1 protein-disulfide reductase [Elizabethkingia meningoseptica]EOR30502.1 putative exported cytochrome C biogenesis-related protein [Elizabethkingia meningoseptica ATCC 13253 = NBRC 12535]KUY15420.1 protein-disulfide reductase [Elizabethkingia meningoseptica]MDE5488897.1 thioredoxin family protein [Elizabethkingia meningoseptica]